MPFFQKLICEGAKELPITDLEMTRFMITLQQGVDFVLKNFERMKGGETFVPKIPSMKITEVAKALAPNLPHKIVGIRPGEKIHETMCPSDDSHITYEFNDYYVIAPTIQFSFITDFSTNVLGESGKLVPRGFSYDSGTNKQWLSCEEFLELLQ